MIRRPAVAFVAALCALAALPVLAQASFGFKPGSVSVSAENRDGTVDSRAGSHPFKYIVNFKFNTDEAGKTDGGEPRDVIVNLPAGLVGNPLAVPQCPRQEFEGPFPRCSPNTQVGVLRPSLNSGEAFGEIFNLVPPPGVAAQLGFSLISNNALQNASVLTDQGYGISVGNFNIPTEVRAVTEEIWGVPADSGHDAERGTEALEERGPPLPSGAPQEAFLTLPTACGAAPVTTIKADSNLAPGAFVEETVQALDEGGNPAPLVGCDAVPFVPKVTASPTSKLAENPSGLDFELRLPNQGLTAPNGIAETQPKKTEVALPQGVTVNPSAAEGIGTCSTAQFKAETAASKPGEGCPEAAKLGTLVAKSPLLDEAIEGSLYLATPHENPAGSLVGLYMVARAPERGVLVKQAGSVQLDPKTGQLLTTFDGLPPIPYSAFILHFREGGRAPLVTPPTCGSYETKTNLFPFSNPDTATPVSAAFQIERGAEGGACPGGGVPSFHPGLTAGTLNNSAGRYSPFNLRLTRRDSEQEITHFSIKLPPGITGKLAGIPFCSETGIATARSRNQEGDAGKELAQPSCPAASEVGHTLVGAGVGGVLTYVPGKVYLAGSYHGSQLSVVAITAVKVGPFDLGNVVIRDALKINPETAEVFIDATGSDPIPHIIDGIPVHARDIRVYVDRKNFVLNPTSCKRTSTASTVLGSGLDFASEADDQPVTVTSPFQAADCASLAFAPKLALSLKGGTKRNDNPKLKAVLTYPKGSYANIRMAQITLPHSEFLDNEHIKTICTRVQFAAGNGNGEQCPAASIYGYATAVTPLLDEPVKGPVFLRSSSHNLPDLVAALHNGQISIDLDGRIDSVKGGRIRNTFESVPDAPVSKFTLEMQGGKKGLLVNSTDLCVRTNRVIAAFTGQNGKQHEFNPVLKAQCGSTARKKGAQSSDALRILTAFW